MSVTKSEQKWKGKASAEIGGSKAEQVWPFLADYCSLNKWFPTLKICERVDGILNEPGCVRYCAGFETHIHHEDKSHVNWTKQKLLSINHDKMELSYSIIDSNVGFNSYVSKMRVLARNDGCDLEWEYEVEPPKGWKHEDMDRFVCNGVQVMAKRMEEALKKGVAN